MRPQDVLTQARRVDVQAMWMMLQQDEPDDFVVATGEMHMVREFVEKAFAVVGMTIL